MHPPRIFVFATILGVLVGCSPSTAPTPTPVPTVPMCTPEFGGTPVPCTQAEYEQSLRIQERYAGAERVFREYQSLSSQESVDRRETPSPEILSLVTEEYGRALLELRQASLAAARFEGEMGVDWVEPAPPPPEKLGGLSLSACLDYTDWDVSMNDGSSGPSGHTVVRVDIDDASGQPRIADIVPEDGAVCG